MIQRFRTLFIILAMMLPASFAAAAVQHVGFKIWNGPVPPMAADPSSLFAQANEALVAKYGAEPGFVGTAQGSVGELLVLASNQRSVNQIWRKMLNSGDAYASGGRGYFRFQETNPLPPTPQPAYQYLGKIRVAELSTGRFVIPNGTPAITSYVVAMEVNCPLARSGVQVAIPGTPIQPTRLVKTTRSGYSMNYEHTVNEGQGALLSAIDVSIGRIGGPIIVDICPVDIYVRY